MVATSAIMQLSSARRVCLVRSGPPKLKFSKWLPSASTRTHSAAIIIETSDGCSMAAAFAMVQMPSLSFQALQTPESPCVLLLVLCIRGPLSLEQDVSSNRDRGERVCCRLLYAVPLGLWCQIFNRIICLKK